MTRLNSALRKPHLLPLLATLIATQSLASDTDVSNTVNYSTDVIYQIVTDRFLDGDSGNNPPPAMLDSSCSNLKKYCGGDWQGIIDKLNDGYFSDMGITALWISQPVENIHGVLNDAQGSTSYHAYWARDFKRTNPYFGTFNKFDTLIQTAHNLGIKIIIDFAPNHSSPASSDDSSYAENGRLYNDGVLMGGYSNDSANLFHHNGGTDFSTIEDGIYRNLFDLADFNHENQQMDQYLQEAIALWLDKGVDGIRVDAVKHMPLGWQKKWMSAIYKHKPVFSFGEWFLGSNEVDPANHDFANNSGMSLLDFQFAQTTRKVFRDQTADMRALDQMIQATSSSYQEVIDQVTFIDNHDMDRFQQTGVNQRRVEQALAFTLTSRGVPGIYYGTEQYLTGNGDPNNRAMMPNFNQTTTAYKVIKALAPLRKSNPALAYGDTQERWSNSDVYVYERQFGSSVVLVAINRSSSQSYNLTGLFTALPQGNYSDILTGKLNGNSIDVSANGAVTPFNLSSGEVGVWQYTASETQPKLGHVGPMMAAPGDTLTLDGRGFGNTGAVQVGATNAQVLSWSDTQVKIQIPTISAGTYSVKLTTSNGQSSYPDLDVLTGPQKSVRFILENGYTQWGEAIYLVGNIPELGSWDPDKAIGPFYNQVVEQYPNWYQDVSVPTNTQLQFKFIKKNGNQVIWESGSNHQLNAGSTDSSISVNWQ
ncbi:alpha-amylase family glycosyl hydrolase [Shewanella nanhaiensis]|uniref:IPT/TIG domain-containing protein n=1 Tax=Shewanella nanhaiensis TaxID=2864872 RepID=A0ABS7E7E3_9GAMM|nr:alpha-amylase family glycosyl hydrolase [Shewanella nanhaiensis]MBW8185606.1 IPT/TIG domain-containing protein [Shewanella nanhaiensis]